MFQLADSFHDRTDGVIFDALVTVKAQLIEQSAQFGTVWSRLL